MSGTTPVIAYADVEHALSLIECCDIDPSCKWSGASKVRLDILSGAFPLFGSFDQPGVDVPWVRSEVLHPRLMVEAAKWIGCSSDNPDALVGFRVAPVTPRRMADMRLGVTAWGVEIVAIAMKQDGWAAACRAVMSWHDGRWTTRRFNRQRSTEYKFVDKDWLEQGPRVATLGVSLGASVSKVWRAYIASRGASTSLCIGTGPAHVRELFALRDLPEGKRRRPAIIHWVREHSRRKRLSPEEVSTVRRHLRGHETFQFDGMTIRIEPSAEDLIDAGRLDQAEAVLSPDRERMVEGGAA